jgi:hypothetical protein
MAHQPPVTYVLMFARQIAHDASLVITRHMRQIRHMRRIRSQLSGSVFGFVTIFIVDRKLAPQQYVSPWPISVWLSFSLQGGSLLLMVRERSATTPARPRDLNCGKIFQEARVGAWLNRALMWSPSQHVMRRMWITNSRYVWVAVWKRCF